MKKPQKKSAGKAKESGNVTLDLGEKHSQKIERMIESKLSSAGMAGARAGSFPSKAGSNPGELGRPGAGGYKPWYSRFGRPWLGQTSEAAIFAPGRGGMNIIPIEIQTVKTGNLVGGMALGLIGNRALMHLTPKLWPSNTQMVVHEGIAFLAGLIPLLFKRNALTVGVAIPGAVYLGGTLVDMLFQAVGMPMPVLSGSNGAPKSTDPNLATRQKLAAMQQRINAPQVQRPRPQVVAQPQFA